MYYLEIKRKDIPFNLSYNIDSLTVDTSGLKSNIHE